MAHKPAGEINNAVAIDIPGWDLVTAEKIPQYNVTSGSVRFDIDKKADPYGEAIVRNVYVGKAGFKGLADKPDDVSEVLVLVLVPTGRYKKAAAE